MDKYVWYPIRVLCKAVLMGIAAYGMASLVAPFTNLAVECVWGTNSGNTVEMQTKYLTGLFTGMAVWWVVK